MPYFPWPQLKHGNYQNFMVGHFKSMQTQGKLGSDSNSLQIVYKFQCLYVFFMIKSKSCRKLHVLYASDSHLNQVVSVGVITNVTTFLTLCVMSRVHSSA